MDDGSAVETRHGAQVVMTVQRTPQGRGNRGRRKQRVGKAFLISQGQANHFLLVDGLQGCGLHG